MKERQEHMGTEFFDELSETISRTAKELSGRAEVIYEKQKLRNKVNAEQRIIDKVMADIGNIIYKRYANGEDLDENLKVLCSQIDQHMEQIDKYKASLANMKGCKVCPSCKEAVDKSAAFCPNCGAACPTPEPEEEAGEVVDEAEAVMEEVAEEATVVEEAAEDSEKGE